MNFIKKIFASQNDEVVHKQFVRFGKGIFERRALITIRSNGNVRLNSTFEYANDLVLFFAELQEEFHAAGRILFKEKINPTEFGLNGKVKQKAKLYELEINQDLKAEQIKNLEKIVYMFFLDLKADGAELKIKKKLPKLSKSKPGKVDDKFCNAIFDKKFASVVKNELFFDVAQNFKVATAEHTFEIKDIILQKEVKNFAQERLEAKRKGNIIRKLVVDGAEQIREKEFVV